MHRRLNGLMFHYEDSMPNSSLLKSCNLPTAFGTAMIRDREEGYIMHEE
jgi:hypothetical protein